MCLLIDAYSSNDMNLFKIALAKGCKVDMWCENSTCCIIHMILKESRPNSIDYVKELLLYGLDVNKIIDRCFHDYEGLSIFEAFVRHTYILNQDNFYSICNLLCKHYDMKYALFFKGRSSYEIINQYFHLSDQLPHFKKREHPNFIHSCHDKIIEINSLQFDQKISKTVLLEKIFKILNVDPDKKFYNSASIEAKKIVEIFEDHSLDSCKKIEIIYDLIWPEHPLFDRPKLKSLPIKMKECKGCGRSQNYSYECKICRED